ncbi:MAG: hypothetical protein FWC60_11720 [Firmicutes bacterium]|nr:hypothetical protein [Bacillota bacterium]
MKRLVIALIVLLCSALSGSAYAVDFSRTDDVLTIELVYGGQALSGIKVGAYLVATVEEVNGAPKYTLISSLAPSQVAVPSDGVMTAAENKNLAQALAAYVKANNIAQTVQTSNGQGQVSFSGLRSGLYLVSQTDADSADYLVTPFLVPLPYNGDHGWSYLVSAAPKTEPKPPPPKPPVPPNPPNPPGGGGGTPWDDGGGDDIISYNPPGGPANPPGFTEPWGPMTPLSIDGGNGTDIPDSADVFAVPEAPAAPPASSVLILPQTGLLRWPIPVLCGMGTLFVLLGLLIIQKERKRSEY